MGHGRATLYEDKYVHVIAVVEFGLADWDEVGVVIIINISIL